MIWRILIVLGAIASITLLGSFMMLTKACSYANVSNLQQLINEVKSGHTIIIPPGNYHVNLRVTKPIKLIAGGYATTIGFPNPNGEPGFGSCIVLGYGEPPSATPPTTFTPRDADKPAIEIIAEGVEIRGLRIRGGTEAIHVINTRNVRLIQNEILETTRAGIVLTNARRVALIGNEISASPIGILLENSSRSLLAKNELRGNGQGIVLHGSSGNRIAQNRVTTSGQEGVLLEASHRNELLRNALERNALGIALLSSEANALHGNRWRHNGKSLRVWGTTAAHFVHEIGTDNAVDGRPILYLVNRKNVKITARHRPAYLALVRSAGVLVDGVSLPPGSQGILLIETQKSTLRNVVLQRTEFGLYALGSRENLIEGVRVERPETDGLVLEDSHANRLLRNRISQAGRYGILLVRAQGNELAENRVEGSKEAGIYLKESRKAELRENQLRGNWVGIYLERGGAHALLKNWIRESQFGIFLQGSSGNVFRANRLENNRHDANVATLPEAPPPAPAPEPPPSKTTEPSSSSKGGS